MSNDLQHIWDAISAPLDPAEIKVREQSGTQIPYIDKTSVEIRLNTVCPGDWNFQVTPIVVPAEGSKGQWVVKGTLTICGVSREDFGMNDNEKNFDPPKAAVSDALKRCAALFGFGRELYEDPRGSIAKANGTQAGRKTTPPPSQKTQPAKTSQKPPASAAPAASKQEPVNEAAEFETVRDMPMSDLTGQELYYLQEHGHEHCGMDNKFHFEGRWKKRWAVSSLKSIPITVAEFFDLMHDDDLGGGAAEPERAA